MQTEKKKEQTPLPATFELQAAVIAAAVRDFDRHHRLCQMLETPGNTLEGFLGSLTVRGLTAVAPVLLELERSLGIVETLCADDVKLLHLAAAVELESLASAFSQIDQVGFEDRAPGVSAVGALQNAAAILRAAAELRDVGM